VTNVSRRRCRLACACLAGVLVVLSGPARRAEAGPVPPSILIVLMDDARFDGVPWLDEMAEEGVRFTHAYATEPHCGPSRAALLTGRFRTIEVNGTTEGFDDSDTLGTRLQAAGYETAFVGKYVNGHTQTGAPPGWDRFLVFSGGDHYFDYELVDEQGTISAPADYSTDYLADAVQDFFSSAEGPAIAIFAPRAPHVDPAASLLPVPAPRHAGAFA
jgi:arylsulfatase A-like enzyme